MGELSYKVSRKLKAIEMAAADAQGRIAALIDKRRSLENDMQIIEAEMKRRPPEERGGTADYEFARALAAIREEIADWDVEMKRRQDRLVNDSAVRNHCAEFVRLLPPTAELSDVSAPIIGAEVGELVDMRAQIAAIKREQADLKSAPAASAEVRAAIRDYVERMAARHTPRIRLAGGGMYVDWNAVDVLGVPDAPFGVMCWAAPEAMMKRLEAEAGEYTNGRLGLAADERARREAQLAERLSELEMREEAMVSELLSAGVDVVRRHDASPAAILGVVVKRGAAAA
jgi:hypothetical protein